MCKCVVLICPGEPEPEVTWLKDGKEIKIKKKDKRMRTDWDMKTDEYILEIKSATKEDIGEYTAVATNEKGTINVVISVAFKVKKETTKKQEEVKEVIEEVIEVEETKQAECAVKTAEEIKVEETVKTEPEITSEEKTASVEITTEETSKVIEEVKVEEKKVVEKPKKAKKAEKKDVEGKPEFITQPASKIEIEEGETITLKCQVKGRVFD